MRFLPVLFPRGEDETSMNFTLLLCVSRCTLVLDSEI